MKSRNKTVSHIITIVCVVAAVCLLVFIVSTVSSRQSEHFIITNGQGTRFDFIADGGEGFLKETTIYTEHGITSITFTGKITVDGIAEISITSDADGSVVFVDTYADMNAESIEMTITGLFPYSYYTLRFYSDNARDGNLALTTDQPLVKQPERPEKSTLAIPSRDS